MNTMEEPISIKPALAVRQVKNAGIFHDCYDIMEEPIEEILATYGICFSLNEQEKHIIKDELLGMAAAEEIKEAVRWAEQEHDSILMVIPDSNAPSPRTLMLTHTAWKNEQARNKTPGMIPEALNKIIVEVI